MTDDTKDGAPLSAKPRSSQACSNATCTDPTHPHEPRPPLVTLRTTIEIRCDLTDATMTDEGFRQLVTTQLVQALHQFTAEYRRLKSGGAPTEVVQYPSCDLCGQANDTVYRREIPPPYDPSGSTAMWPRQEMRCNHCDRRPR